jgi:hypothetical protein
VADDENSIKVKIYLTPHETMPFGIVCLLNPSVTDSVSGTIQKRMSIRIPLWDENDVRIFSARLTSSGHGIVLQMPATASYLLKKSNVKKINEDFGADTQTANLHFGVCNRLAAENGQQKNTYKVLLLFPKGMTCNNNSFNEKVKASDDFSLEKKASLVVEKTLHPVITHAMRSTVAFDVAVDPDEDGANLDANADDKAAEDDTALLFSKMAPFGGANLRNMTTTEGKTDDDGGMGDFD